VLFEIASRIAPRKMADTPGGAINGFLE